MTFTGRAAAVQLLSLAPQVANAATEANFGAATTADLVELCTAVSAVALSEPWRNA
jgi:hypothetical protein